MFVAVLGRGVHLVRGFLPWVGLPVADGADGVRRGAPLLKLVHPVGRGGLWREHHVRPVGVAEVLHVAEQLRPLAASSAGPQSPLLALVV